MKKLNTSSYSSIVQKIEKTSCGTVYPLSIAEMKQYGEIYIQDDSVLLWHYGGFAFIFGDYEKDFLENIYQKFLHPAAELSRRFILFSPAPCIDQFFQNKSDIVLGKRYLYEYPNEMPAFSLTLPSEYQIREIDEYLYESIQGRVTPSIFWRNTAEFVNNGKGYCVLFNGTPASWAFSAAASSDEIDIGIETSETFRHKGLGMIAVKRMIQYCFEQHKRPIWSCDINNIASQKIAEKAGFVKATEYSTIKHQ